MKVQVDDTASNYQKCIQDETRSTKLPDIIFQDETRSRKLSDSIFKTTCINWKVKQMLQLMLRER